jgi:hypothetical protein
MRSLFKLLYETPGHATYGVWINGGKAGDLTVRQEERTDFQVAMECGGFELVLYNEADAARPKDA